MYTKASKHDIAAHFGVSIHAVSNRLRPIAEIRSLSAANCVRYRKMVELLTPEQAQLVYGSLLGDACLYRQQRITHFTLKVCFAHGQDQLAYLEHKRSVMGGSRISQRPDGSNLGKPVYQFAYSNTQGLLSVESIVKRNGVKCVSEQWLQKLELPGIAYWYQDDASIIRQGGKFSCIRWYTNAFDRNSIQLLVQFLRSFSFTSVNTLTGNNKPEQRIIVCYGNKAIISFLRKLKPYSVPCLRYKFPV